MKQFVLLLLVFIELACSYTPAPTRKSVYGDPGPNTIAVTVGWGFYFRGTYHLPAGTKVGLLLDIAKVLPSASGFRDGVVGHPVPCSVRSASKKYEVEADFDQMNKPVFRNRVLHDGDELAFIVLNF
ncbi:MAG: hypothetical protein ACYC67_19240 [Prosthecobacter sp.]